MHQPSAELSRFSSNLFDKPITEEGRPSQQQSKAKLVAPGIRENYNGKMRGRLLASSYYTYVYNYARIYTVLYACMRAFNRLFEPFILCTELISKER